MTPIDYPALRARLTPHARAVATYQAAQASIGQCPNGPHPITKGTHCEPCTALGRIARRNWYRRQQGNRVRLHLCRACGQSGHNRRSCKENVHA